MPPKTKPAPAVERKLLLGSPGNTLSMGIVGLPNVGKSSTFNLLGNLSIPAENFPFCTIEPNEARVPIPDTRFDKLVEMWTPRRHVPAFLEIVDIAGLVPGASEGVGLGNAFLSNIARVDGIYQVVRAFNDPLVVHTEGEVDPVRDLNIILSELIAKDLQYANWYINDWEKGLESLDKHLVFCLAILYRVREVLEQGTMIKDVEWPVTDIATLNKFQFLTAKPVVYLVNLSPEDYSAKRNRWLVPIKNWVDTHGGGPIIPYSVLIEQQAMLQPPEARATFFSDYNTVSSISRIIKVGYSVLNLIHYFTCGEDEVKCWTIRRYTKAPQAAGVIHTDFERGFICAEVMKYDDFIEHENEAGVRAAGKLRQQCKEYEVEDGDIIFFRFNVSGSKDKR